LAIARKIDKPGIINHCLYYYCSSLVHTQQFVQAIPYVEELLISSETLNQPWGIMIARHLHSDCALGTHDYKEAEKRYGIGIETGAKYGSDWIQFVDMQGVAFALSGQSRWAKCIRLNAASGEKGRSIGMSIRGIFEFWDEWIDTYIDGAKEKVGEELTRRYEEEGKAMGFEKAVEYALDFERD
jgi:translation elongation factor EF-G